jgi:hypothetical protein
MVRTYLKNKIKRDVSDAVIQEAVRTVRERRLSLRVAASIYGMTHAALYYRIEKISSCEECNRSDVLTSRQKLYKFSKKTGS